MRYGLATIAVLAAAGAAHAQTFSFNFEPPTYSGAAAGTLLSAGGTGTPPVFGQDNWYLPVAGSAEFSVYTYAGNTLSIPAHPSGDTQFAGGRSNGGAAVARGQHGVCFGRGGKWRATYDFAANYNGTLPAADNLASFSLQPSATARYFQTLMAWGGTAVGPAPNATNYSTTADKFHQAIGHFTVALPATIVFETPSPAFRDLLVNNWYRVGVEWDFATSTITSCSIQDLTGGGAPTVVDVSALGWKLFGGPGFTNFLPSDLRLFAGGAAGNVAAFDNVRVEAVSAACYADCNGDGVLTVADFGCYQTAFVANNPYADCNCDGTRTVADFGCFQTRFVVGCP